MPDITLMGATYPDVPAVELPKGGGGTAVFHDVSDTTAIASDVASGKLFHAADGTLVTGTASGGGGGAVKMGALRPDAELVKTWSYDGMMIADLGVEVPAYVASSSKTVKTTETLGTYVMDTADHNWLVLTRTLTIPIYSTDAVAKGREEYQYSSYAYEYVDIPDGTVHALVDPTKTAAVNRALVTMNGHIGLIHWSTATGIAAYNSTWYGIAQRETAPTSLKGTLTVKSPAIVMRGNGTYFSQTYWEAMTDCRIQYVIELYRTPKSADVDGWVLTSQALHVIDCAQSADHKLT